MNSGKDDTFLGRWLNNELTDEELNQFKASDEYPHYQKLLAGVSTIEPASFEEEHILERVKSRKSLGTHGNTRRFWISGVAASIAILLGVFWLWEDTTVVASQYGELKHTKLLAGSVVTLNANSRISYSEDEWDELRTIQLAGEAFFDVTKGSPFVVETKNGRVEVLGTQFNVIARDGFFEVVCYEGRVSVKGIGNHQLNPGDGVRFVDDNSRSFRSTGENPGWMNGESSFEAVPAKYVIEALVNQYDLTFEGMLVNPEKEFTGAFPHDNLDVALQVVLGTLQIDYQLYNQATVRLVN